MNLFLLMMKNNFTENFTYFRWLWDLWKSNEWRWNYFFSRLSRRLRQRPCLRLHHSSGQWPENSTIFYCVPRRVSLRLDWRKLYDICLLLIRSSDKRFVFLDLWWNNTVSDFTEHYAGFLFNRIRLITDREEFYFERDDDSLCIGSR